MTTLLRTHSAHPHFQQMVALLDADLAIRNGDEHAFFSQYNKSTDLQHTIVAYHLDIPVGCGAIKPFSPQAMEIKRMYVHPDFRGKGIAAQIVTELENWTRELGLGTCVLETGLMLPEAIALYKKLHYQPIPNYGPYVGVANSVCFQKDLV